jgi:AcrR family transcriptional regulator
VTATATLTAPSRTARRPQAERSAETRRRVVEAAIGCLHRLGYAATTVSEVALAAGVSRGAMTHQFPAKTDLMVAVVRAVFRQDSEAYAASLAGADPVEWMRQAPHRLWAVVGQPSGVAVMEIMLASRSDPELATRLREMQERIDREAFAWMQERRRAAGLADRPDAEAIHRTFVAAARGLALEALFMNNREAAEASIAVLAEALAGFYPPLAPPKDAAR